MARTLTYLAISSLIVGASIAACGENPNNEIDSGQTDSTDGLFGTGSGGTGSTITPGGIVGSGDVVFRATPEGFKYDDGTGNPAFLDAGLNAETVASFRAAIDALPAVDPALEFYYPFENTMVPGNLTFLDFQWKGEGGTNVALVRAIAGDTTYHMYLNVNCNSNGICDRAMPSIEFQTLGKRHAGQDVAFEVIMSTASGFTRTVTRSIKYSPERLNGALYYWAAADNTINRVAFGAEAATPFIIPGENADYECVSCHSVSRDGSTIAFGVAPFEGENISGIQVARTADPSVPLITPTPGVTPYSEEVAHSHGGVNNVTRCATGEANCATDNFGHNVALSPTGEFMAVNRTDAPGNWYSHLEIRRTDAPSSVVATYTIGDSELGAGLWGLNKIGLHPEYSPDGKRLVVTLAEKIGDLSAWSNQAGSIAIVTVNGDGSLTGPPQVVATPESGAYHFYPTWSPDGKYVAFMTAWAGTSLGNRAAVMHMVPSTGNVTCPGAGCIELAQGTGYTSATAKAGDPTTGSTWPKFAPFAQGEAGNVYFITFTSRRKRGLTVSSDSQLWMFGIDTTQTPDPSFAPFWLPWQQIGAGSLAPYWTEALPCNAEGETCNGCLPGKERCVINTDDNACMCEGLGVTK